MKKSKFIKSTFILLIGGFFTKILGMTIKIVTTRLVGTEGMGLYMLIMPTFSLLIAIAQMGMPVAISKLVAENKRNNKNLVFSSLPISLGINIIIMIILIFSSKFIANNLLHDSRCSFALTSIGFVLPFICISSILRGYFFGRQKMFPHVISNITEDIIRLIIMIIGIPFFLIKGIEFAVCFIVLSNIISELTSILILFFFLPKNFSIKKEDFVPHKNSIKEIFGISLPTTASRLIGNIGYFFEPIILTFFLLKNNYSNSFIVNEYGILNGYVMPLLLLPSFFTQAISQALIPVVSNNYANNNLIYAKNKIKQGLFFSLMIGIPATLTFLFIPQIPLKLIYNTNQGISYIKFLAPICLLHYIQGPISASLQAMGKAKEAMYGTLIGMIIRTLTLIIGCNLKIGLWGLIFATSMNIVFVTLFDIYKIKKILYFKKNI
ncbi:MAG: hypothetical protein E7165_00505 [Firmicutes bacterium]|nr:hypothetical protein [Bacillota bacterium]